MRRIGLVVTAVIGALFVAAPAQAFAHNAVQNAYLHAALDVLTFAAVTAPVWTAYLWGRQRRALLAGLVGVVQLPVAVIAFVPIAHPVLHAAALVTALTLTGLSLWAVRRTSRAAYVATATTRA